MNQSTNKPDHPVEVRLTKSTIEFLEARLEESMRRVIKESINQESARLFWEAGIAVVREEATQHTGRFVLGGIKGVAAKGFTFMMLGSIVYAIGGWAGLAKLWAVLFNAAQ